MAVSIQPKHEQLPERDSETFDAVVAVLVRFLPPEIVLLILESGSGRPWDRLVMESRPKRLSKKEELEDVEPQGYWRFFYPIPATRPVLVAKMPAGAPGSLWSIAILVDAECHDPAVMSQHLPLFRLQLHPSTSNAFSSLPSTPRVHAFYNLTAHPASPRYISTYTPGAYYGRSPISIQQHLDFSPGLSPWGRVGRHTHVEWFRPHLADERGDRWNQMLREGCEVRLMPMEVKGRAVEAKVYRVEVALYGGL